MKVEEEGARKVQLEAEKNNGQEEEVSVAIEVETDLPVLEAVALEVLVLEAAQDWEEKKVKLEGSKREETDLSRQDGE